MEGTYICGHSGVQLGRGKTGADIHMAQGMALCIKKRKCVSERMALLRQKMRGLVVISQSKRTSLLKLL